MTTSAILGEYSPTFEPRPATNAAIAHSKAALGLDVGVEWIATDTIDASLFDKHGGIWVAPGSPYRDMPKTLEAIRYARERGVPCFGTCGGMQHIIIEYARNVLGFPDAQHAEYDPYASELFISAFTCSLAGREMDLRLTAGSQVARIYGATTVTERYYCNFGVHPDRVAVLGSGPLRIVGWDVVPPSGLRGRHGCAGAPPSLRGGWGARRGPPSSRKTPKAKSASSSCRAIRSSSARCTSRRPGRRPIDVAVRGTVKCPDAEAVVGLQRAGEELR